MHKNLLFSLQLFFLYLIYSLGGYDRNKTRPRRRLILILRKVLQFRVGAIPSEPNNICRAVGPFFLFKINIIAD